MRASAHSVTLRGQPFATRGLLDEVERSQAADMTSCLDLAI